MAKEENIEFVILGTVVFDEETRRKRIAVKSEAHLIASLQRLTVGDMVAVRSTTRKLRLSDQQRAYHWVLMGLLSDYSGHSSQEMHEFVMVAKFGKKRIAVGDHVEEIRRSVSRGGGVSKEEMSELIEYDLALC